MNGEQGYSEREMSFDEREDIGNEVEIGAFEEALGTAGAKGGPDDDTAGGRPADEEDADGRNAEDEEQGDGGNPAEDADGRADRPDGGGDDDRAAHPDGATRYDDVKGMLDVSGEVILNVARRLGMSPQELVRSFAGTDRRREKGIGGTADGGPTAGQDFASDGQRLWVEFFFEHPEMTPESVAGGMLEDVRRGMTPREAYLSQKLRDSEFLRKQEEKRSDNRRKAIGRMSGESAGGHRDAFEEAFDSVFGK